MKIWYNTNVCICSTGGIMASVVVQFRVEEDLKNEAVQVYENIGIDLSSALRTFLKRSIKEKGFTF